MPLTNYLLDSYLAPYPRQIESILYVLEDVPDIFFDVAWCAVVAAPRVVHRKYESYLYFLLSALVIGYPGGVATQVLSGQRPLLWSSNINLPAAACFYLFCLAFPQGIPRLVLSGSRWVTLPLRLLSCVSTVRIITYTIRCTVALYPQSLVAPFVLGVMSASVGGWLNALESRVVGRTGATFSSHWLQLCCIVATFYLSQLDAVDRAFFWMIPAPLMSEQIARIVATAFTFVYVTACTLVGEFGLLEPLEWAFTYVVLDSKRREEYWQHEAEEEEVVVALGTQELSKSQKRRRRRTRSKRKQSNGKTKAE